jgi:DNA invertase Pin-like site-specific DNA recombinase
MNNQYGYIRVSPKIKEIDQRIKALNEFSTEIKVFVETNVRGRVPLGERPQFQILKQQLNRGDELVVWWLSDFGREFEECHHQISALLAEGVTVKTLNQSLTFCAENETSEALLRMLQGYAEHGHQRRLMAAHLGRKALLNNPDEWQRKFRGRRGDSEKHAQIAQLLFEGKTLQSIAEETETSMSTVKRVKARLRDSDDLGELSTRGNGRGQGRGDDLSAGHHHGGNRRHGRQHAGRGDHHGKVGRGRGAFSINSGDAQPSQATVDEEQAPASE